MPLYDYICPSCQHKFEEIVLYRKKDLVKCEKCLTIATWQFPSSLGPVNWGWPDGGITMEHAGPRPVHFENRQQAKEFEKKNNVKLGCL